MNAHHPRNVAKRRLERAGHNAGMHRVGDHELIDGRPDAGL
jgi:hypothetical protein